ncbi:MAG: hypothetical protein KDB32_04510 [Planctomycetes bacterium]|nr:hypothetical protein [Planctomycetota bacterium]
MNRLIIGMLASSVLALAACESTPKRYEPEPEPEPQYQPEPEPDPEPEAVPPQLDKSKPPERVWQAMERESIDQADYQRPTFGEFMDGPVAKWRNNLSPAFVPGKPHAMQNVKTSESWSNGKASLKVESTTLSNGGWKAHGYGTATYNSNGALYAKCYFREGQLHGPAIYYNEDGSLLSISCYNMGSLDGPYALFDEGNVKGAGQYSNGPATGVWNTWDASGWIIDRSEYTAQGSTSYRMWARGYNKDGQLTYFYKYENGNRAGDAVTWVEPRYDDDGKLTNESSVGRLEIKSYDSDNKSHGWQSLYSRTEGYRVFDTWYEHGAQTGPFIQYNRDGRKIREGQKTDGTDTGRWKEWSTSGYEYEYGYGPKGPEGGYHGLYVSRDPSGNVVSKGNYQNGKLVGEWLYVSPAGAKTITTYNKSGLLHGKYTIEDKDGNITTSGTYEEGKAVGTWKTLSNGGVMLSHWPPVLQKQIIGEGKFENGSRSGPWKWSIDGTLIAEGSYANGLMTGTWSYYELDGTLGAVGQYDKGSRHGTWETFGADGTRLSIYNYQNERLSGEYKRFYSDGTIKEHGVYKIVYSMSKRTGDVDFYSESGELIIRETYDSSGNYKGKVTRESALTDVPSDVEIDPLLPNGIWLGFPVGATTHTQRMRVINGKGAGLYEQFYSDGTLGAKGEVYDTSREGLWSYYYADGTLKETATFTANVLNGDYSKYREDGTLAQSGSYTSGNKTGSWKTFAVDGTLVVSETNYNADGKYEGALRTWNDAGQMLSEKFYKDGIQHGTSRTWHTNGSRHSDANYAEGRLDGSYESWFEDGTQSVKATFKEGQRVGSYTQWGADGKLLYELNYDDQGARDGAQKEWYPGGQLKSESSYAKGVNTGDWSGWYEDGTKKFEYHYDAEGKKIGTWKEWNPDGSVKSEVKHDPEQPEDTPEETPEEG